MDTIQEMYAVIEDRKRNPAEGSYTCYLFEKGLDKILKKCGEECAEMIIAAKNENREELIGEIGDLVFHTLVLMSEKGIELEEVQSLLKERSKKIGNLKQLHKGDKES